MNEIKYNLVVTVKITGDLGGRLRSHLLGNVEQLFNFKTMLAGNRVCEVIKLRLTVLHQYCWASFILLPRLTTASLS